MNISTVISNKFEESANSPTAIASLQQFIKARVQDIADFVNYNENGRTGSEKYLALPVSTIVDGELKTVITRLSQSQYMSVLSDDVTELALNYTDKDKIVLTSEQINDAMADHVSDIQCQESFVSYCLASSESCNVESWLSRLEAAHGSISPTIKTKYMSYLDGCSNSFTALQNMLASANSVQATMNNYITIIDPYDYDGCALSMAFTIIVEEVSGFFNVVWEGISKIGEFIKGIFDGIVKLSTWLLGKIFPSITTVFEKVGSHPNGIMDLPLAQISFEFQSNGTNDRENFVTNFSGYLRSVFATSAPVVYPWNHYAYTINYNTQYNGSDLYTFIARSIYKLVYEDIDGKNYATVSEIFCPDANIIIRVGLKDGNTITLALYKLLRFEEISNLEDKRIFSILNRSFDALIYDIEPIGGIDDSPQNVDDTSIHKDELAETFGFTYDTINDYLPSLRLFDLRFDLNGTCNLSTFRSYERAVLRCLFTYCMMSSTGLMDEYNNAVNDPAAYLTFYKSYTPSVDNQDIVSSIGGWDINEYGPNVYTPYVKAYASPVNIHFQTTEEQAKEILQCALTVACALAAAVITVKLVKWKRNRIADTYLQSVNLHNLASVAAGNPTPENMSAYLNARKKFMRMSKINSILGLTTEASSNTDIINSGVESILNSVIPNNESTKLMVNDVAQDVDHLTSLIN